MALITGGGGGGAGVVTKIFLATPTDGATRASTAIGSFSTPWTIANVQVAANQNVKLTCSAHLGLPGANDWLLAFFRGVTQIAAVVNSFEGNIATFRSWSWIDQNPGAGTYTYEVEAAMFTAGTLTLHNSNPTTDSNAGSSIFIAEVYTP